MLQSRHTPKTAVQSPRRRSVRPGNSRTGAAQLKKIQSYGAIAHSERGPARAAKHFIDCASRVAYTSVPSSPSSSNSGPFFLGLGGGFGGTFVLTALPAPAFDDGDNSSSALAAVDGRRRVPVSGLAVAQLALRLSGVEAGSSGSVEGGEYCSGSGLMTPAAPPPLAGSRTTGWKCGSSFSRIDRNTWFSLLLCGSV